MEETKGILLDIPKKEHDEMCCIYASLICHESDIPINAGNLLRIINATGNSVPYNLAEIFANMMKNINISAILVQMGIFPDIIIKSLKEKNKEIPKSESKTTEKDKNKEKEKQKTKK